MMTKFDLKLVGHLILKISFNYLFMKCISSEMDIKACNVEMQGKDIVT